MKHFLSKIIICGFLAIGLSGWVFADEQLDKESLEALISGNTVEGVKVKWKTTYQTYFDPSGNFGRIDSNNNKEGGAWKVEQDGSLTMTGRKQQKRIVKQRDDDGYDVYNWKGQVIWTIDKVTPGNPYNLEPSAPALLFPK